MADPTHAWYVLGGVLMGLGVAAGATWWVTRLVKDVLAEAKEVIKEMKGVVAEAKKISYHVSNEYVPLKQAVRNLEIEVAALRKWITGTSE